jgi:transcriptional regulator with XRE-family HTH domain
MNAENKRLKKIRETLGDNQTEFSEKLGIKQGSLSDIERGKNDMPVSDQIKMILYKSLGISKVWFETGKGEMFVTKKPTSDPEDYDEIKRKYYEALEEIARLSKMIIRDLVK